MKSLSKVLFICLIVAMSFGCLSQKDKEETSNTNELENVKETKAVPIVITDLKYNGRKLEWTIPSNSRLQGRVRYEAFGVNSYESIFGSFALGVYSQKTGQVCTAWVPLTKAEIYIVTLVAYEYPSGTIIGKTNSVRIDNR